MQKHFHCGSMYLCKNDYKVSMFFLPKGRMNYSTDGSSFYDGDWVNNVKHGFGTRQYASQNLYEGMWFNNMRHGEGTMRWLDRNQMYSGQWQDGTQVKFKYIYLTHTNSAIHKAAGSLVTGRSQKTAGRNAPPPPSPFLPVAPIHSQWTLFCSTGIVPVEIMEWPGTVRPAALWIVL